MHNARKDMHRARVMKEEQTRESICTLVDGTNCIDQRLFIHREIYGVTV